MVSGSDAIEAPDGVPEAEIVGREDVRPAKAEDKKHLGRPFADALHGDEFLLDRFASHPAEFLNMEMAALRAPGEVFKVVGFRAGDAGGSEARAPKAQNVVRSGKAPPPPAHGGLPEAKDNSGRGLVRKLLGKSDLGQRPKSVAGQLDRSKAYPPDNASERGIAAQKLAVGLREPAPHNRSVQRTVAFVIVTGVVGRSPAPFGTAAILSTVSMPSVTRPKMV